MAATKTLMSPMNNDDWQVITGISSAVIALCALVFSIWQGIVARRHNRLSVRPHLSTWTHRVAEKGFYSIEVINNGIGPAIIEEFTIKVDGKTVTGNGVEAVENVLKILFPGVPYEANHGHLSKDYSMVAKERCELIKVQFLGKPVPSEQVVEHAMNRCDLEITYKSFYGEAFHFSTAEA